MMNLADGEIIHFYETPGQKWLDLSRNIFENIQFFLNSFGKFIAETIVSIGDTEMVLSRNSTIAEYHAQLQDSELTPNFVFDARVKR